MARPSPWPAFVPPPDRHYHGAISPRTNRRHLAILATEPRARDVLDWGCGNGEYRPLVTALGRRYVGVDVAGPGADVRGDAHALPFRDGSFDHVITNAVLEHVADPFLAVRELARVLRSGGRLSGSVAFLEPHHYDSYFHLSPDGVVEVLTRGGLAIEALWPQEHWLVFDSLAEMPGPITAPTRLGLRLLARLERLLRSRHIHPRVGRRRWLRRRDDAELRDERLTIAGQVDFLARKT